LLLLLILPVVWGAERAGLRGGVTAASVAGLSLLALRTLAPPEGRALDAHLEALATLPPLVLFSLVGALRGAAWDRERALAASLERANRELRDELEQSVRALSSALEAKDAYTDEHVARVAGYALALGRDFGLAGAGLEALGWAARLHDLGKIGVPERVLGKPGPLDAEERALVRRHPEIGARILSHLPGMSAAAPLVLHHQERWDGGREGPFAGYPSGLAGDAIPLGARIIAVVDAFDAMTTDRPYRAARPLEVAVEELRRESGRQFDPVVVERFLDLLARRPWHGPAGGERAAASSS
jgi:HD-GYP domain-containing protein (c-di-GMP phosphodiesterase class II)